MYNAQAKKGLNFFFTYWMIHFIFMIIILGIHFPPFYIDPYAWVRDNFGPITIPEKSFFMMGDNRDFSRDSRNWGFLDRELIIGKALFLYWPLDKYMKNVRWERIGQQIQ